MAEISSGGYEIFHIFFGEVMVLCVETILACSCATYLLNVHPLDPFLYKGGLWTMEREGDLLDVKMCKEDLQRRKTTMYFELF